MAEAPHNTRHDSMKSARCPQLERIQRRRNPLAESGTMYRDEVARVYELFLILMSGCYPPPHSPHEPCARGQTIILQECNKPAGICRQCMPNFYDMKSGYSCLSCNVGSGCSKEIILSVLIKNGLLTSTQIVQTW